MSCVSGIADLNSRMQIASPSPGVDKSNEIQPDKQKNIFQKCARP